MRAVELDAQGWAHRDIAVALDVTEAAVSYCTAAGRRGGEQAIRSRLHSGCPAKLSAGQLGLISNILWHGAEAYGFRGDVWTCARVAAALVEEVDVSYSRSQVSRILKRLKWTPPIPITRAIQRNEAEIERWRKEERPILKRVAGQQARMLVFVDEAGFYLLLSVVKTYATAGQTPVLNHWEGRDHLSVICGVSTLGHVYSLVTQSASMENIASHFSPIFAVCPEIDSLLSGTALRFTGEPLFRSLPCAAESDSSRCQPTLQNSILWSGYGIS